MSARYAVLRSMALAIALILLALVGCDPSSDIIQVGVPGGTIQGTVRTGDITTKMFVRAIRVDGLPRNELVVEAEVSLDGSYGIDVPVGRYVISLEFRDSHARYNYTEHGLDYSDSPPDTLRINEALSPRLIDFDLASIRLQLDLPAPLNGQWGSVRLHLRDAQTADPWRSYQRNASRQIRDGKLNVELSGVVPGEYKIEVVLGRLTFLDLGERPFDGEYLWMPGVRDSAAASWTGVQVDQTVLVTGQVNVEPARLQGVISGAWQVLGLSEPALALVDLDSNLVRGFRVVAPDGGFNEEIYLPVPVKLVVRQNGIEQWIGGNRFEDAEVFALQPGLTITGVEYVQSAVLIELQPPHSRIDFGWVRIYDAQLQSLVAAWRPRISGFGPFLPIANLAPGTYLIQMEPSLLGWRPWAPQWIDRAVNSAAATSITITTPGEIVRIPVTLERGGTISGMIRDTAQETDGFSIFVTTADSPMRWGSMFSRNQTGEFLVQGLPDGNWKIGVWRGVSFPETPPKDVIWYPGVPEWNRATTIVTSGFNDVTDINIVLR